MSKRIKVSDASRSWRVKGTSGEGDATGRQLCLVAHPARTQDVARRVVKTPARTEEVAIPAEYRTVKVRKLVEPAKEVRVDIPAEYATVTKQKLVKEGAMGWVPVLCETNTTPQLISGIQNALKSAGHDPGPIRELLDA